MIHERTPLVADRSRAFRAQALSAEFLDAETETSLALAWRDRRDEMALHRLVTSYTRLAIKVAGKYSRTGAPADDLIQEAGLGIMTAAEKFDPDRGYRFSTYAVFWMKAQLQDYVLRNHSMVRMGTTHAQRTLFSNLRKLQTHFARETELEGQTITPEEIEARIAERLGVTTEEVRMMDGRLGNGDRSLNAPLSNGDDETRDWIETIEDEGPQAADLVEASHDNETYRRWVARALGALSERERLIIIDRKLRDEPRTLDSLGDELNVSRERLRQIEVQALHKMRKTIEESVPDGPDFF